MTASDKPFSPTDEQSEITNAFSSYGDLVIEAGAGCGKSSVLCMVGNSTKRQGVGLAFNKAVAQEMKQRSSRNVVWSTGHSLAFRAMKDQPFMQRLNGQRVTAKQLAEDHLKIERWIKIPNRKPISTWKVASLAVQTVTKFCHSAEVEISGRHVPFIEGADMALVRREVLPHARAIWEDVQKPDGFAQFQHDHYMKIWSMQDPVIDADFLLIDEVQDLEPCLANVVRKQDHLQRVLVGDSCQRIFSWRGSVDLMREFPEAEVRHLSLSFRFGDAVADEANRWLDYLEAPIRLRGLPSINSRLEYIEQPDAILCRTNADVMEQAMAAQQRGFAVAVVGGTDEIAGFAAGVEELRHTGKTKHRDLSLFKTWPDVQAYVRDESPGGSFGTAVRLIERYGTDTVRRVAANCVDASKADFVVSTVHKCVHPDTLIETASGLMPIKDAAVIGVVAAPDGPRFYEDHFTRSAGDMVKVRTRRGYEITITKDHGMTAWRDGEGHVRVEGGALVIGDILRLRRGVTIDVDHQPSLPAPTIGNVREKRWTIPSIMSDELSELLGLLVADGTLYANDRGVRVVKRYASVIDRFAYLVRTVFGYEVLRSHHGITPRGEINSTMITRWLRSLGGLDPHAKGVQTCVLASPAATQARFLRGLFEDGTVNEKGGLVDHVHWENIDHALAGIVQTMLLRMGIVCTRKHRSYAVGDGTRRWVSSIYIYSANARLFAERVGFIAPEKNARLQVFGGERSTMLPILRSELSTIETLMKVTDKQNARLRGAISLKVANLALEKTTARWLRERTEWLYDPIVSIEPFFGESMCVTVPDGSRFLQNGFDGWNCKGLEYSKVLLDPNLAPDEARDQQDLGRGELMVNYVASTRAQHVLDATALEPFHSRRARRRELASASKKR